MAFWDFEATVTTRMQKGIDLKVGGLNGFTVEFEEDSQTDVTDPSYFNGGEKASEAVFYHDYDKSDDIYIGPYFSDRMVGDDLDNVFKATPETTSCTDRVVTTTLYGEKGE